MTPTPPPGYVLRAMIECLDRDDPTPANAAGLLWVRAWLAEVERGRGRVLYADPVEFELAGTGFLVDGHPAPVRRMRGLALAWLILAAARYRTGAVEVDWVFPGKGGHRRAKQCLDRAADAVRPLSQALAKAIDAIGTRRGIFIIKGRVPPDIDITSPALIAALA